MDNVLATVESKVSPEAIAQGAPKELSTGHINYGKELFDMYAGDEARDTMVKSIVRMADALTQDQFEKACKDAQSLADNIDAALGWKAPSDAKGQAKYGTKRRTINSRMSEAKAIFGVYKMDPGQVTDRGYWSALTSARDYLKSKGLKWDGAKALNADERESKKKNKEMNEAIDVARKILPQMQGETAGQWLERCVAKAEALIETDRITGIVDELTELEQKFGTHLVMSALVEYVKTMGPEMMEGHANDILNFASELREKAKEGEEK